MDFKRIECLWWRGGGGWVVDMNEYETHLKRGEETDVQVHISGWCISHLNCKSMDVIAQLLAFWCTNNNIGLMKFNCCHRGMRQQQFAVPPKSCKKWNVGRDSQMCMEENPESKDSWTFHFIWQVNWLLSVHARIFFSFEDLLWTFWLHSLFSQLVPAAHLSVGFLKTCVIVFWKNLNWFRNVWCFQERSNYSEYAVFRMRKGWI